MRQTALTFTTIILFSGCSSFWGDAYTVRKWMRNLCTKIRKCVPTKQMTHFKSTFTTKFIKRLSEIKWSSQTMHAFLSYSCVCSAIAFCNLKLKITLTKAQRNQRALGKWQGAEKTAGCWGKTTGRQTKRQGAAPCRLGLARTLYTLTIIMMHNI